MESAVYAERDRLDAVDIAAIVLSVLAPGLGHIILGQALKGVVILALVVASCGVGYIVAAVIALDAYLLARARKHREVGPWEIFPERRRALGF
jgi:TM2 domain-containing membrane protein YozV